MKIKYIIGSVLIALGVLAILGAVGHLDYLNDCGVRYGAKEVREMVVRSVAGFVAVGVGAVLCRDIEVEVEKSDISADQQDYEEG